MRKSEEFETPLRPRTGKRGRGRPPNSTNRMSMAARQAAAATGLLPHEILLSIARGEPQLLRVPDPATGDVSERLVGVTLEDIKDCAKAAAPYYAPKLSTVETIQGVTDDDLDSIIALAATQAGVSVSASGEGKAG